MSCVQKRRAIIRGAECSDYALTPSSACSFFLSSLSVVLLKCFLLLTRHCRCIGGKHKHEISLDGSEHRGRNAQTERHSNPPRQQVRKNQATKKRGGWQRGGGTKSRRLLFHCASQTGHISDSLCGTAFLIPDHPRRIAAVKLLTSSSASVMTLHFAAKLSLYLWVCERLSLRVFDGFISLSHDLYLNQGFRKEEGVPSLLYFLCFYPLLPVMDPPNGGGAAMYWCLLLSLDFFQPVLAPFNI